MGAREDRHGPAGVVRGPFLAQIDIKGFPKQPIAAFLRPEERDIFLDAVQFVYAMREGRQSDAKEIIQRMVKGRYYPKMKRDL